MLKSAVFNGLKAIIFIMASKVTVKLNLNNANFVPKIYEINAVKSTG